VLPPRAAPAAVSVCHASGALFCAALRGSAGLNGALPRFSSSVARASPPPQARRRKRLPPPARRLPPQRRVLPFR